MRVKITLVSIIIILTLVLCGITLCMYKLHYTCRTQTRTLQNHTHVSKNPISAYQNHTLLVKITLCVHNSHLYVLKLHSDVCSDNWVGLSTNKFKTCHLHTIKVKLLSPLNSWDSRFSLFIIEFKGLKRKKKWREKMVPGKKCPFMCSLEETNSGSQRKIVSWIGAEDPSSPQHCQKVFNKDRSIPHSQRNRT
jgi:hypothetical protein